ncbi:MAG: hypothetical protein K2F99_05140 [Muribaculaceae bacterium]|nr:hypothetical protein [Muribaculaceae bacterium]
MSENIKYSEDCLRDAKVSTLDFVRKAHVDNGRPFWVTCQVLFGPDGNLQTVCPLTYDGKFFTVRKVVDGVPTIAGFPNIETQQKFEDLYFKVMDLMKSGKLNEALRLVNKEGDELDGEARSEDTSSGGSSEDSGGTGEPF